MPDLSKPILDYIDAYNRMDQAHLCSGMIRAMGPIDC